MMYRLMRALFRASLNGFFSRIIVDGAGKVPAHGPVLIVANHTNAFVDALLILTSFRRRVTLTAKSTLRQNPLLALTIRGLDAIELHRAQDGANATTRARNDDAIDACARRLARGGCVVVFPEGVSHSDMALRPFHSGAARIALAYAKLESRSALRIVPIGLHFEAKDRFRSVAGLVVGDAVDLESWRQSHPAGGARALTSLIEARVRAVTTNYEHSREAATIGGVVDLLGTEGAPPPALDQPGAPGFAARTDRIHHVQDARRWMAQHRPAELARLERRVHALFRRLGRASIAPDELFLSVEPRRSAYFVLREIELLLAGGAVIAWGWLNNAAALAMTQAIVRRKSGDRDHVASNAVFMGIPIFLAVHAAQCAVVLAATGSFVWAVLYAISLPYAGIVALLSRDRGALAWRRLHALVFFARRPQSYRRLKDDARSLLHDIHRLRRDLATATQPLEVAQ